MTLKGDRRRWTILDLRNLAMFVAVVESGGYVAAGRALGVAQSNVSYRVARLESALKCQLFKRHGYHGVTLTKRGRKIHRRALKLLRRLDRLAE